MTIQLSSNKLVPMALGKGKKMLTLEVDEIVIAEFAAAAEIIGARSSSSLLHQQVKAKIREAKQLVSNSEFESLVQQKLEKTKKRSQRKAQEHKNKSIPNNIAYFPHKGDEIQELGSSNNFADDEGKFKNYSLDPPDGEIDPVLEEEIKKIEARRKATGKDDSED